MVCLGVGGLVDLGEVFGLETETGIKEQDDDPTGGLEFWVLDARRPWNLGNVFGGRPPEALEEEEEGDARRGKLGVVFGEINQDYKPGKGGVIVFDDGDISEELEKEREAYFKLELMPEIEDDGKESDFSESESEGESPDSSESRKRKRGLDEEDEGDEELGRPRQRRRSESVCFAVPKIKLMVLIFAVARFIIVTTCPARQKRAHLHQFYCPRHSALSISVAISPSPLSSTQASIRSSNPTAITSAETEA